MRRDREQATAMEAERLAVLERERGPFLGAGVAGADGDVADWRAPQVAFKELQR
jgi:hypothetical protein